MKLKIVTKNENQTMQIAEKLAKSVFAPCVISLVGNLGVGKTTFSKGFAKGLGITDTITSPTFTILNEYTNGKVNLYHFDLYRLESLEDANALGFEEYFDLTKLKGIVLVEWANNCKGILPTRHFEVTINKKSENEREIEISPKGLV